MGGWYVLGSHDGGCSYIEGGGGAKSLIYKEKGVGYLWGGVSFVQLIMRGGVRVPCRPKWGVGVGWGSGAGERGGWRGGEPASCLVIH